LSPPRRRALSPDLRHAVGRSRGRGQESARVRLRLLAWRLGFGLAVLVLWEAAAGRVIDPFWFSSPLRIARHLIEWVREGTLSGLRAVEPAYQEIARVMGASERQIFFKVSLPAAAPWIVSALKVGVPFSLIGAIIGEFMAASRGLGYMIQFSTNQFDTTAA